MNFDNNPVNINASIDSAVLAYKQNQYDRAETECRSFLQENPNNANALYLYGLVLQKQGNNDQAIDYINKAISTDAAQIATFQSRLIEPVQNNFPQQSQDINAPSAQMVSPQQPQQPQQPASPQSDDDPFKATRELLKRFEREQSMDSSPSNNQEIGENQHSQSIDNQQQPFSINMPQRSEFKSSVDNSQLISFIQKLYSENFSANVLFWTDVDSSTIGNLNQFPGMKFNVWHDEIKSHEYYTQFLKDIKLRSLSVITSEKVMNEQWDLLILPYTEIDCPQDPIGRVSYKYLYLANDFMNAPNRQMVEATLKSKGCVSKGDVPCVFERKDQLKKGESLFSEGKIEEAIQCFEDVLAGDPNNTDAYNNLGVISYSLGNAQSAETFLLKTLEIDPNHINALMNIADVYCAGGLINEAAEYLTKAVELEPKNPDVWISLSRFYKQIGSEDEAQSAMKKGESLQSNQ